MKNRIASNLNLLKSLFQEFLIELKTKAVFEVIDVEQDDGKTILILRVEGRLIKRMTPQELILDDDLIEGLSPKAIRAITYLAVLEQLAPEFNLLSLELDQKTQEYLVLIKNNLTSKTEKESATKVSKNKTLIKKLSSDDANRIGYMAGINDTVKDFRQFPS